MCISTPFCLPTPWRRRCAARARRLLQPHSDKKAQNVQKRELFKGTDILIQQFIEPNCD